MLPNDSLTYALLAADFLMLNIFTEIVVKNYSPTSCPRLRNFETKWRLFSNEMRFYWKRGYSRLRCHNKNFPLASLAFEFVFYSEARAIHPSILLCRSATRLDGARGKKQVWRPLCSNLWSFGSRFTVLKKVLVTLLGLFGSRGIVPPSIRPCFYRSSPDVSHNCHEATFKNQTRCKYRLRFANAARKLPIHFQSLRFSASFHSCEMRLFGWYRGTVARPVATEVILGHGAPHFFSANENLLCPEKFFSNILYFSPPILKLGYGPDYSIWLCGMEPVRSTGRGPLPF